MPVSSDFHSHVTRSSARAMAQAAKDKGLRVLGLSEHIFQMSEARALLEHMELEGPLLTFQSYQKDVARAIRDLHFDVRLVLEVDFIPEKNKQIQASISGYNWDFLIGSVHQVDGIIFERAKKWEREEGEARWLRYFALLCDAVRSGWFSFVSHPVRMRSMNPFVPPTFDQELEQLAAEATRCNVALEINGYDVLNYPNLVRRLAKACALHRTPISVGSDAHKPSEVAQMHRQSETMLRDVGITTVRIWKQRQIEEYKI